MESPENLKLIRQAQEGNIEARNKLIVASTNLIWKWSFEYSHNDPRVREDYFQQGVFGYIKGINKFKEEKKCNLNTCCFWWVRHALVRYRDLEFRNFLLCQSQVQGEVSSRIEKHYEYSTSKIDDSWFEKPEREIDPRLADLKEILPYLSRDNQELIHLKYTLGLTHEQIAARLRLTHQTISNRLGRLLYILKKYMISDYPLALVKDWL